MANTGSQKPHLLLVLADDLGFANVGWNRKDAGVESKEVQTPVMDQLVSEGVQLTRFYAYKMCSPTRSALQTGRYSMHVNHANSNPAIYNPDIGGGTGAGIPRNMTGIATQLRKAGYRTHMAGKWDAGMATPTHTPHGRGYESGLSYFHHANNMWTEDVSGKAWPQACGGGQDLYDTFGPAYGIAHDKAQTKQDHRNISGYEEYIFSQRLISKIQAHDPSEPLFLFY
jgi:arylsulfatase I/J